jgi:sulfite reductase (NADPH) hemoprotein beta-component
LATSGDVFRTVSELIFFAAEVPEVIEAVIQKYLDLRLPTGNGRAEYFIETLRRVGQDPFKVAANGARHPEPALA